jgi:predicted methyltransferase
MQRIESKILNELAESKKSLWKLLEKSDFLLTDFISTINKLYKKGLVKADKNFLTLTQKGRKMINKEALNFKSRLCDKCSGKRILLNKTFTKILKEYRKITKGRPSPTLKFFQGYMNAYDVIARVAFIHFSNDLENKKFVLIGDDDLLSIALALTNLPRKICVLDIDERLGSFIEKINKKYRFEVDFYPYNVAEPLPKKFVGKFDVFSSEPLETLSGLKAFIVRGVSCLKENSSGYFGLTRAEASYKKWLEIEKILTKMNCVITDLISGFSKYPTSYENISYENFVKRICFPVEKNNNIEWYKSSLFRFEVIGKPKPIVQPNKKIKVEFFDPKEDITLDWTES